MIFTELPFTGQVVIHRWTNLMVVHKQVNRPFIYMLLNTLQLEQATLNRTTTSFLSMFRFELFRFHYWRYNSEYQNTIHYYSWIWFFPSSKLAPFNLFVNKNGSEAAVAFHELMNIKKAWRTYCFVLFRAKLNKSWRKWERNQNKCAKSTTNTSFFIPYPLVLAHPSGFMLLFRLRTTRLPKSKRRVDLANPIPALWSSGCIHKAAERSGDYVTHWGSVPACSVHTPFGWR